MRLTRYLQVIALGLVALGSSAAAFAETVEDGQNEILGFVGAVSGGGHAALGGGIQHGIREHWLISGELAYVTGNDDLFHGHHGSHGVEFDANLHFLIPLRDYPRFTPYLLGGFGLLNVRGGGSSDTSVGLNLGGGARWALGKDWGIRPELKFLISDGSSTRFTLGIYKRF